MTCSHSPKNRRPPPTSSSPPPPPPSPPSRFSSRPRGTHSPTLPIAAAPDASPRVPASATSAQPDAKQELQRATNAQKILQAINVYTGDHDGHLPPDLGTTLRSAPGRTLHDKAAAFISPADPSHPQIPDSPDADWVNKNTSFVYLGNENVKLMNVPPSLIFILRKNLHLRQWSHHPRLRRRPRRNLLLARRSKKTHQRIPKNLDAAAIFTP